jgi:hypothetical protein
LIYAVGIISTVIINLVPIVAPIIVVYKGATPVSETDNVEPNIISYEIVFENAVVAVDTG